MDTSFRCRMRVRQFHRFVDTSYVQMDTCWTQRKSLLAMSRNKNGCLDTMDTTIYKKYLLLKSL